MLFEILLSAAFCYSEMLLTVFYKEKMEKAEEKFLAMKKIYTTLLGMFADEMKQEELEKDECYGCAYGKCGPCIGICYKSMKA